MAKRQFTDAFSNIILAQLSQERLADLRQHLQRIELEVRKVIYEPNRPIDYAYFVETGVISIISIMNDGASIEVGAIGKEGLAGACLLLGAKSVPYQYFVQIAGYGYSMKADKFKSEAAHIGEFRDLILRFQSAFQTQTMQAAACNGLHSVTQRCCRWLLTAQDRMGSDTLALTHEFLALMLGARRASVTDVLRPLQDRGWIQSKRGEITVLDRKGLESGSCECYRIITDHQKQLMN
jgi:CRP-like cAMP-binding protein